MIVNFFFVSRQDIVNLSSAARQPLVNRQSSIVSRQSSTWQKIHLFCAVFTTLPVIGVGLCYLCMRNALRKVRTKRGKKLF